MRTFIAIPLTRECQSMLGRLQDSLRSFSADVRWVAIPSIHLTLKFLGDLDPAVIPALTESLELATRPEGAIKLRIHGLGCFPNHRNPRVIWCGVGGETEDLGRLYRAVEGACASIGFAPEDRPFHPHLTLGRVNGKRNLQPLLDCIKIGSDLECGLTAGHYNVYKSTLRPQGAEYTVLKTIVLGGQAAIDT
jgi:2'-5' RNA ligase